MPSEKSRYLNKNRGPSAPLKCAELKAHLHGFEHERLLELLMTAAQRDTVLWKALMACASIQLAHGNWEKTKAAIDYAFHFQDVIRYTDCHHGIILDEMIKTLEILSAEINAVFAMRVARYILESGQDLAENFEDDWDWSLSLDALKEWVNNHHDT